MIRITRFDAVLIAPSLAGTRELVVTFGQHQKFLPVSTRRISWLQKAFAPHMEQDFVQWKSSLVIVVEALAVIMTVTCFGLRRQLKVLDMLSA